MKICEQLGQRSTGSRGRGKRQGLESSSSTVLSVGNDVDGRDDPGAFHETLNLEDQRLLPEDDSLADVATEQRAWKTEVVLVPGLMFDQSPYMLAYQSHGLD